MMNILQHKTFQYMCNYLGGTFLFHIFFPFQNESEFKHQLRIVRNQQMGFLSAASMESGSYQRGYEHIVR